MHFQCKSHIPQDFHKICSHGRVVSFTAGARFPLLATLLLQFRRIGAGFRRKIRNEINLPAAADDAASAAPGPAIDFYGRDPTTRIS
jgi:hypothetical protein